MHFSHKDKKMEQCPRCKCKTILSVLIAGVVNYKCDICLYKWSEKTNLREVEDWKANDLERSIDDHGGS